VSSVDASIVTSHPQTDIAHHHQKTLRPLCALCALCALCETPINLALRETKGISHPRSGIDNHHQKSSASSACSVRDNEDPYRLRPFLPAMQIVVLGTGQDIEANAHRFEFEGGNQCIGAVR
jgi:hypothetical protein